MSSGFIWLLPETGFSSIVVDIVLLPLHVMDIKALKYRVFILIQIQRTVQFKITKMEAGFIA